MQLTANTLWFLSILAMLGGCYSSTGAGDSKVTADACERDDQCRTDQRCESGRCQQVSKADAPTDASLPEASVHACDADSEDCKPVIEQCIGKTPGQPFCEGSNPSVCGPGGQSIANSVCPRETPVCAGEGRCVVCQPNENACLSSATLSLCDVDGNRSVQACGVNQTCHQGRCEDTCIPGTFRCAGGNSQKCDADRTWYQYQVCAPHALERCDGDAGSASYGLCVDNPAINWGKTDVSGTPWVLGDRFLLAQPLVVPVDATLLGLGLRTTANSSGGSAYLALHADADGRPGKLINYGDTAGLVRDNTNFRSPMYNGVARDLIAKTKYWLVATIATSGPQAPEIAVASSSADGPAREGSVEAYLPPNDLSPSDTVVVGGQLSLFVSVRTK